MPRNTVTPNERHRKLAQKIMLENTGSISTAMRELGYKEGYVKNPQDLVKTDSFQRTVKPIVERLVIQRDNAEAKLNEKIDNATYRDLVDGIEKMTRVIELLTGGVTDRQAVFVVPVELAEKNKITYAANSESKDTSQGQPSLPGGVLWEKVGKNNGSSV